MHRLLRHGGQLRQTTAAESHRGYSHDRRDRASAWQYTSLALLVAAACTRPPEQAPVPAGEPAPVASTERALPGIDRLIAEGPGPLRGLRVGLITNHTGRTGDGARSTIDVLHAHPDVELVALFSPEHGIRGAADAGVTVESGRDARTGLPIHSLYGETRAPTETMLQGIDALVFDIQDIGARYYTYVWTMALAMQAAAEHDRLFVVLDRPNPIGGTLVQGNVLDPEYATFVGLYPVPMRHGMTVGELARYLNAEHDIDARLHVVPAIGWTREQWLDDTAMRWQPPSPNMPTLESAAHYPGTCLFEGTNLSVGRGTGAAFQQIGAPWLDAPALVERLRALGMPGVRYDTVQFTPQRPGDGKYPEVPVRGIRYTVTDRDAYDPTRVAIATLVAIRAMHPDSLAFLESHFDRLAGTDEVRRALLAGADVDAITADWDAQLDRFRARRADYLLYP